MITVHDLSVPLHPEWHPADRARHFETNFASALDRAQHIITDAACVRSELIEHYAVRPDRVSAIPIGLGDEFLEVTDADVQSMRRDLSLPEQYLLCVGTIEPRKNIDTLLTAYCDLPASVRLGCPLVIAGGWGWKALSTADRIRRSANDGVIHVGFTPDRLLPALYAGARALLCPSHYEGFGLPPLEMLGVGGAVVASTAAAHCEVLGSHAHFVDAMDVEGWRTAMTRSIAYDEWLDDIRRGGAEHARQFTWARCASATIATYRSILQPRQLAA